MSSSYESEEGPAASLVVGIAASAGGLEAVSQALASIPADSGMAIVYVCHLDPDAPSKLAEVLTPHTSLRVVRADEDKALEANSLYVMAPGTRVCVQGGHLRVRHEPPSFPDVADELFRSLAREYGHRAVGIILSGAGSDGASGLRELRAAGGMTIAQRPNTAAHRGMPTAAIERGAVEVVVSPDEIGPTLARFAGLPEWAKTSDVEIEDGARIEESARARLSSIFAAHGDIDLRNYKPGTIDRRLLRRMGIAGYDALDAYLDTVAADEVERRALIQDLLIGVTDFFRDSGPFELLAGEVIPGLVRRAGPEGLRFWVAGCSTGEEAYSITMLAHDAAEQAGRAALPIHVFATDVDSVALTRARAGIYAEESIQRIPEALRDKYLNPSGDGQWQIQPRVRGMISFALHDLCGDPPFSRIDLVTCRNVLIYLRPDAQERVLQLFHFALNPSGYLLLGASESIGPVREMFEGVSKPLRLFRKRNMPNPLFLPNSGGGYRHRTFETTPVPAKSRIPSRRPSETLDAAKLALLDALPPSVVVSADGLVLYTHGELSPYLRLPAQPRFELQAMAREHVSNRLRAAIYKCRRDDVEVRAITSHDGDHPPVEIVVRPAPHVEEGALTISFAMFANEGPAVAVEAPADDPEQRLVIEQLERELLATREDLQHTVEELEGSNEELRASNEESMSMNEELQSANEELEATTEELRSLNEELSAVNARLKEKVEELEQAHDDLSNFFASTKLATVFLDDELRIKRFTPAAQELLHLDEDDVGRSLREYARPLLQHELADHAHMVLNNFTPISHEISGDGRWYVRRVLPYRTESRRIEGVVVSYMDVTDLKRTTQQLAARERQHAVLANFGMRSFLAQDLGVFMHRVIREVRQLLDADCCRVSEIDPDVSHLHVRAQVGFENELVGLSTSIDCPIGAALTGGETIFVEDLAADRRFGGRTELSDSGIHSGLVAAIEDSETPYGAIEVYTTVHREFTADDANFLRSVASVLANAVARHRTRQRLAVDRAVAQILADAVSVEEAGNRILHAFRKELAAERAELWLTTSPTTLTRELLLQGSGPEDAAAAKPEAVWGETIVGRVWASGEAEWRLDALEHDETWGSCFAFPITSGGQVRGVLAFYARDVIMGDQTMLDLLARLGHSFGQFILRAEAEQRLATLASIVEWTQDAVISKDMNGTILSWNRGAQQLYGYAEAEVVGRDVSIIVPPEKQQELVDIMARLMRGERIEHLESERVRKDGTRVDVSLLISPIFGPNGEIVAAAATARDITERKKAEAALRDSEARLHAALRHAPFPLFIMAEDGELVLASLQAYALLEFSETEEYRLRRAVEGVFGVEPSETRERVTSLQDARHEGTYAVLTKSGARRFWDFHSSPMGTTLDGRRLAVSIAYDLTEMREAEERLRDSEWRFRQVLVNSPIPMMVYDETGTIIEISKTWRDATGYGLNDAPTFREFAAKAFQKDADNVVAFVQGLWERDGHADDVPLQLVARDGDHKTMLFNAAPLGSLPDGRRIRVVAAADITSQKAAEEQLRAADRLKDQFLAMLGHELRNPLAAIRSAAEVLKLVDHDDPKLTKIQTILDRQTAHMAKLVNGLLDVTRIARGKIELDNEIVDVSQMLRELVEDHSMRLPRDRELTLAIEAEDGICVAGDRVRLRQVFDNLISNAVQFTTEGDVRVSARTVDGEVEVSIADTGRGIDHELLPHVFEPFRQADQNIDRAEGGLGLGLALVNGLVQLHGGGVGIESMAGEGTTVTVHLPVVRHTAEISEPLPESGEGWSFLVIEDNRDFAEALGDLLDAAGNRVRIAFDGTAGLEVAREAAPDVILCDIGLPGAVSGYDVARAIREDSRFAQTLLVALTGYGRDEDKKAARDAGFDHHLTKPVDLAAIERILAQAIHRETEPSP